MGEFPAGIEPAGESHSISLRTLMLGLGGLALAAVMAFSVVFLYQYWKPRYGALVLKTTPPGAAVMIDGEVRGESPLTVEELRSGAHQIKLTKEGYRELIQQVEVIPYAAENHHWALEPMVPHLTNEQLAEVEAWRKKLDAAQKEGILLPPPEDYNVLFFANRILTIDPANEHAVEVKARLTESVRSAADVAYAREDWLEAEKQFKNLMLLFPEDISIGERLADISSKIEESIRDREQQVADWRAKAEAALAAGSLVPPEKDNAMDAIRSIQRLDRKNEYAREALVHLKSMLQNRGDTKMTDADWEGARREFRLVLQHFPDDAYSTNRLRIVEARLDETAGAEQQRLLHLQEEQQSRIRVDSLRQSALTTFHAKEYQKSVSEWQEYLQLEPNSDEAYYYIGAANLEEKQVDTAILNFEKCLSLNSGNVLAHLNLGILYDRHRNDLTSAEDHFRRAKELGGFDRYTPERLQVIIADVQDRLQVRAMRQTPFAVEHKHMFTGCRGNLRLTEEGVEFKTVETDHSFYESYRNLRSFSVQDDEISLRIQDNKKYNFRLLNPGDGARVRRLAQGYTPISE